MKTITRTGFWSDICVLPRAARSSDEMRAFLDWAARTGFNGLRVFAGKLGWASQNVALAKARLPELLNEPAARGLYAEVTAITDSRNGGDPADHFRAIARIAEQGNNAILEVATRWHRGRRDPLGRDAAGARPSVVAAVCARGCTR